MKAWFQRRRIRRLARKVGDRLRDDHGNHLFYPLQVVESVCANQGIRDENSKLDAIAMFVEPDEATVVLAGTREERRLRLIRIIFHSEGPIEENPLSNCFHDPDDEIRAGLREIQRHPSPGMRTDMNEMPSSNACGPGVGTTSMPD